MRKPWILLGFALLSACRTPAAEVVMAWQESGFRHGVFVSLGHQDVVFKREPAYAGERVLRAALALGTARDAQLPYALDWTGQKLYLDLNHNLDLTDDPALAADEANSARLVFKDVALEAAGPPARRYRADLEFPRHARFVEVEILSGWAGTWPRGASTWRVVFVDDLDGEWDDEDLFAMAADSEEFRKDPGSSALEPLKGLFMDGVDSELALAPGADGTWLFTMRETPVPMGRLRVSGALVERIVLQGGTKGMKAILPIAGAEPVAVPAGRYPAQEITLATSIGRLTSARRENLEVREGEETVLKVGAPLQNSGEVRRDGGEIRVQYLLTGVGGETYRLPAGRRSAEHRPRVEIFQGGRRVTRGAFEFG
ncbi:MAG: hypothetical protein KA248_04860 [Kiritimatiellae bacterium]|nr:hypothetical protein [Kiritimatiellia bacterium]